MKRIATLGIMTTLLLVSIVTLAFGIQLDNTEPATSKGSSVLYEGTCDNWYNIFANDTWYIDYAAKIVESNWDIIIQGGKAIFSMKYMELNIEEEIPGTYDNFKVVMITSSVEATPDGHVLRGSSYWWKNEVFLMGPLETVITISETNLPTQFSMVSELEGLFMITGSLTP